MNPLLGPTDPLPYRPQRVLVAGTSGSGKTTLARRIAAALDLPHTELDALHHGPAWTPRPEFGDDVARLVEQPVWVTEWQYTAVRELLLDRADCLVWLDLPRAVVLRRVVRRTLRRRLRREVLWNGNVEPPLRTIFGNPDHIVRWAWRTHGRTAGRVADARRRRPDLPVVRLPGPDDVDTWVRGPLASTRCVTPVTASDSAPEPQRGLGNGGDRRAPVRGRPALGSRHFSSEHGESRCSASRRSWS